VTDKVVRLLNEKALRERLSAPGARLERPPRTEIVEGTSWRNKRLQ